MKIIFSRKGFDAQCGGQPSPVLPDGTLLSLPIPRQKEVVTYADLSFQYQSYFSIIQQLKKQTKITAHTTCHLDPDIRKNITAPFNQNRKAIFGQCDAALTLLTKYGVGLNDIFLFFGWFKETEYDKEGHLKYKSNRADMHLIYGYLQVGEVLLNNFSIPQYAKHHAHAQEVFTQKRNNALFVAKERLSFNNQLAGSGCLKFNPDVVLTMEGMSRSRWKPHYFFKELPITYHNKNSFCGSYFQSAAQGQEFIMEANDELENWVKNLIDNNGE